MTPEQRAQMEAQADRARRRGELAQALSIYAALCEAFPEDPALRHKRALAEQSLQPMELQSPKAQFVDTPVLSLEQRAELHVNRGELHEALLLYREALRERPDNELLRERLAEVFAQLRGDAPPPPPAPPADPLTTLQNLLERLQTRRRT